MLINNMTPDHEFAYNEKRLYLYYLTRSEHGNPSDPDMWHGEVFIRDIPSAVTGEPPHTTEFVPKHVSDALAIYVKNGGYNDLSIDEYLRALGY